MILTFVEGHGEVKAIGNLLSRLWIDLGLPPVGFDIRRWPNLYTEKGIVNACSLARISENLNGMLIIRDDEDRCPKIEAPKVAGLIRNQSLNLPVAFHVMYREYETLFLACSQDLHGKKLVDGRIERPGLIEGRVFEGDPESRRDAKGWLSTNFPANVNYKPTTDQLLLTRLINFETLRRSKLPMFETLERCLLHLAACKGTGKVYPK